MENIIENNKLIAEFLGGIKQPFEFPQFGYINSMGDWKDTFFDNQLKFHSNWNWLMSVVEKIENLQDENNCAIYNVQIEQSFTEIIDNHTSETIVEVDSNSKIEAVYQSCVEFIKWYNEQNKNNESL